MKAKKNTIKTYRDIPYSEVEKYADKHQLNIDTPENYREAAMDLFNKKYAPAPLKSKNKNLSIKQHLENITVENLMQFRSEAFASMASSSGKNGSFNLGVNGLGQYVVKSRTDTFTYDNPIDAINKYVKYVSN